MKWWSNDDHPPFCFVPGICTSFPSTSTGNPRITKPLALDRRQLLSFLIDQIMEQLRWLVYVDICGTYTYIYICTYYRKSDTALEKSHIKTMINWDELYTLHVCVIYMPDEIQSTSLRWAHTSSKLVCMSGSSVWSLRKQFAQLFLGVILAATLRVVSHTLRELNLAGKSTLNRGFMRKINYKCGIVHCDLRLPEGNYWFNLGAWVG